MADSVSPAIVTGIFGLITTILITFKKEIVGTLRRVKPDEPYDDLFRPLSSVEELLPGPKNEARRMRPFDAKTKIETALEGKAIRFQIRADHGGLAGIFLPLFLSGWLMAWTLGVFSTAAMSISWLQQGPVEDSVTNVHGALTSYMMGALVSVGSFLATLAGEVLALYALKRIIVESFGRASIVLLPGQLVLRKNSFGLSTRQQYNIQLIDGFDNDKNLLFFKYGVKRIRAVNLTDNELDWLKPEIGKALTFLKTQIPAPSAPNPSPH
jgi:hypothetical protein